MMVSLFCVQSDIRGEYCLPLSEMEEMEQVCGDTGPSIQGRTLLGWCYTSNAHALLALWLPVVHMYASQQRHFFIQFYRIKVTFFSTVCMYVHLDDVIWKT